MDDYENEKKNPTMQDYAFDGLSRIIDKQNIQIKYLSLANNLMFNTLNMKQEISGQPIYISLAELKYYLYNYENLMQQELINIDNREMKIK